MRAPNTIAAAFALLLIGSAQAEDCAWVASELERSTTSNIAAEIDVRGTIADARGTELESEAKQIGMDYVMSVTEADGGIRALLGQTNCAVVDPAAQRRIEESFRLRGESVKRMRRAIAGGAK